MNVDTALENMSIFMGSQGMRPESSQALFYLNRARRLVYPLDDWTHTIRYGCIRLRGCCFALPEDCASIRAAWSGKGNIHIENEYFDSIDRESFPRLIGERAKFYRTGITLPVPFESGNQQIGFQALNFDDAGKKVSITYYDVNNNLVADELSLLDDFQLTETSSRVNKIHAIGKERTVGSVSILKGGRVIYTMSPEFTSGRFEQYKVDGNTCGDLILVKCKLRFRDYTKDDMSKLLDIESIDALEFAAKALYHKSQSEIDKYQRNLLLARTHLEVAKEDLETSSKGYAEMRYPSRGQQDQYGYYNDRN